MRLLFSLLCLFGSLTADLQLRDNLRRANAGDFLVIAQNRAYTILHIYARDESVATIEEIVVPEQSAPETGWKEFVESGAPSHSSWVRYDIDLATGHLGDYFSFTQNSWFTFAEGDCFLSTLLNLPFQKIPTSQRKRIGSDRQALWQPRLVIDGKTIPGVSFEAFRANWPKDGSELSNKSIEIYIPANPYPSYFPYWLQVSGWTGKAKVRIIDSGSGLKSPMPSSQRRG